MNAGSLDILQDLPVFDAGTVWLVGAGPGDPGLLTLHAVNALRQADVLVYDALVSDEILRFAKADMELEFAGKRGGRPSHLQTDITQRLIELAQQGKRVLRLKGGDPFVFGRGGEEALELVKAGVPFRVVPGLTSGIASLAYAGIPATTRNTNAGVILATGHSAEGTVSEKDWQSMAATGLPIILYMAMSNLPQIVPALIAGGAATQTPVALVAHATTKRQRVMVSTLEHVVKDVAAQGFSSPAIVAIGQIVTLREVLAPLALTMNHLQTEPDK